MQLAQELEAGKAARQRLDKGVDNPAERERLEEAVRIGEAIGISRERARQIEADAMRKLRRATPLLAQFKEYAE